MRVSKLICLGALALVACQKEKPARIHLLVGAPPHERTSFAPLSALAEYVEVPGVGNELRIQLASYQAACDRFIPPGPQDASVSLVVQLPGGLIPTAGTYTWSGLVDTDAGVNPLVEKARVIPTARLGRKSYLFQPGGAMALTRVELEPGGTITGTLALEFGGDSEHPATAVSGNFSARVCKLDQVKEP